jgi:hypothetical protein
MLTKCALALVLSSALADTGQLTISNVRTPYGYFGPDRPNNKVLPGDVYVISFDVDGFAVEKDGKVAYSMAMEVSDHKGKVIYNQPPTDMEATLSLGGSKIQASTTVTTGVDQPPGVYTIKLAIVDKKTKASQKLTRELELVPKDFGIVRVFATADPGGVVYSPFAGVTGQYLRVNLSVVGFERAKGSKQPDILVEMQVLDENGKTTLGKPFIGNVNNQVGLNEAGVNMHFHLALNQPGKFTIELKATDNLAQKTAKKVMLPLVVTEQKGSNPE